MRIAARVWSEWHARAAQSRKPSIDLFVASDATRDAVVSALATAIGEAMRPRVERAEAAGEFRPGYCTFMRAGDGVILRIDEGPDEFAELLQQIADRLDREGIDGELDLYMPPKVDELPEVIDLFQSHLRVSGELAPNRNGFLNQWRAEGDALLLAAEAGVEWCARNAAGLPLSLRVGLLPTTVVGRDEARSLLFEAVEEALLGVSTIELTSATPLRFRTFAMTAHMGRVAFIEGGDATREDWPLSVRHLTDAMRAAARWSVYGFLKRGSRRQDAVLGNSLRADWLDIPHMNALVSSGDVLEDRLVPDAFGVQLLSGGHRRRFSGGPDWRLDPLGDGKVLVEHVHPEVWFDGTLVRFGGHPNPYYDPFPPTPGFLTRAREDFEAILYRDGRPPAWADVLGERRFLKS